MHIPKRHLSQHRRARLIAWTLAMLAWLAWVFVADRAPSRRHMRQRYGLISLDRLARKVALLILVRAGELAHKRRRANPFLARCRGRARQPRHICRSIIGSRLRRALKHRDFTTRITILTDALRRLDVWARRYVRQMRRGLTRLWPIRAKPAPSAPLSTLAAPGIFFADSS
ncbi:MAG: hypothetical protein AB7H66_13125 [Hyphomonadaceae bacterium]